MKIAEFSAGLEADAERAVVLDNKMVKNINMERDALLEDKSSAALIGCGYVQVFVCFGFAPRLSNIFLCLSDHTFGRYHCTWYLCQSHR